MTAGELFLIFFALIIISIGCILWNTRRTKRLASERAQRITEIQQSTVHQQMSESVGNFHCEIEALRNNFIAHRDLLRIQDQFQNVYTYFTRLPPWYPFGKNERTFLDTYAHLDSCVGKWNKMFVEKELEATNEFFANIEGKSLDVQQRTAAITDEDNLLVVAGAGSGKTLTICGKVRYLIERKHIRPEEILLISYTNKATEELKNRVSGGCDGAVDTKTFHKLGLDLITESQSFRPNIAGEYFLQSHIQTYFASLGNDPEGVATLMTYFGSYIHIPEEFRNCASPDDVAKLCQKLQFETLRSTASTYLENIQRTRRITHSFEQVKSFEELAIANYLYLNGIDYEYERPYPYTTRNPERKPYQPDFYLPEYDLYLEHFGISADGSVPWLPPEKAREYLEGIKWKRSLHQIHGTTLLETYSYYQKEGVLLSKLEELLRSHGVIFRPRDLTSMYTAWMEHKYLSGYSDFVRLLAEFITLYKSNGYTDLPSEVFGDNLPQNPYLRERTRLFLEIVSPIFSGYQKKLQSTNQIDFSDMIHRATDAVNRGSFFLRYRYIVVDEFQDISVGRFQLIQAIRKRCNAKVVCVGDDWQSIFRFAGSDIGLFTNFETYFGYSAILKIEKTYRNSQELVTTAGKFVMENPKQLKKELRSEVHNVQPVKVVPYKTSPAEALKIIVEDIVADFGDSAHVMVLGRTNYDIEPQGSCVFGDGFSLKKVRTAGSDTQTLVISEKYPHLVLEFLTVHRSKGLEADNVIILNLENRRLGFPNKIVDDPILELVLTQKDGYLYGEERRLFYVALTRTRNNVYLPVPQRKSLISVFVPELIYLDPENVSYPTEYSLAKMDAVLCPKCGAAMVKRHGKYGWFYGCSRYPDCRGTRSLSYNGSGIKRT